MAYRQTDQELIDQKLPLSETKVLWIPQVITSKSGNNINIEETTKDKLFYERESFKVTANFKLDVDGDKKEKYDSLAQDKEIKVALYKKNPDGRTNPDKYEIWADNSGPVNIHKGKVSQPEFKKVSDTEFTVSFTIIDQNGSLSNEWDDGAKYRIFAWTNSNENIANNDDFGQAGDSFPVNDKITTIPSTTTTMAGVLGQQVESIIHYPKQITMMDNVRPDNKNIFSGNEKITIQPILDNGNKAEIPNPDVGVDVVIQELNGKSTFDISRGSVNIPLKGFIGTVGNETGIPNTGKLGTLKFDPNDTGTQDMLEFYFRSENPPTVADGPAFEGTIHFEFSNGSGTTN